MKRLRYLILIIVFVSFCGAPSNDSDLGLILLGLGIEDPPQEGENSGPPVVIGQSPTPDFIGAKAGSNIILRFSRPMDFQSVALKTVAGPGCSGNIQVSRDNFASCEILQPLEYPGNAGGANIVITTETTLESEVTYQVRLLNTLKDLSGASLEGPGNFAFQAEKTQAHSVVFYCGKQISELAFRYNPANGNLHCLAYPAALPKPIIRKIVVHPIFLSSAGDASDGAYNGQNDVTFNYANDAQTLKDFNLSLPLLSPSLGNPSTFENNAILRLAADVTFSDGQTTTTYFDVALEKNPASLSGEVYALDIDLYVLDFQSGAGEIPKTSWKAWIAIEYPNGRTDRSVFYSVPAYNIIYPSAPFVVRPAGGGRERIIISVDSTGDGVADYEWLLPDYAVTAPDAWVWAKTEGLRVNGVNQVQPPVILVP
ncbi:MAG: Ig-like domain-containing protein [Leptospiraceae bacterium]|nr:Ig-like domain-containing protein [Leptospiraceae bacterium]